MQRRERESSNLEIKMRETKDRRQHIGQGIARIDEGERRYAEHRTALMERVRLADEASAQEKQKSEKSGQKRSNLRKGRSNKSL